MILEIATAVVAVTTLILGAVAAPVAVVAASIAVPVATVASVPVATPVYLVAQSNAQSADIEKEIN